MESNLSIYVVYKTNVLCILCKCRTRFFTERFGRVDTPLRVEPPPSFNAPARPVDQTQDQQIQAWYNICFSGTHLATSCLLSLSLFVINTWTSC